MQDKQIENINNDNKIAPKKSLKVNFVFNFISQVLTLVLPLITAPYVARVLHEEGIGQFSYALSIITYFTLFANLGFDVYGQRQIARYQDDIDKKSRIFWEIFFARLILTAIATIVLFSILFSVGFGEQYNKLILIASLSVVCAPLDIQFFFRGNEDFRTLAIRTIAVKVLMIACIFIFVKKQEDLWIYALCSIGLTVASNIVIWPTVFKKIKRVKLKSLSLKEHLIPSLVIFLPTLATIIYSVFDKTMIGMFANNPDYENGCYEQAYKLNSTALILVTIISSIMTSRNAHDYEKGDIDSLKAHLNYACSYVWMVGIPLIVGFAVLSGNLSAWFLGEGYNEVPLLMQIMSVRFVVSGLGEIFGSQLFIAIGKEKYCTIATFIAAAINLILNFILIKPLGATGAAIATAACEISVTAILAIFARKLGFVSFRRMTLLSLKNIVAAAVMFVPIFFMQKFLGNGLWQFIVITLVGIIVYALALLILRDKFFITNVKNVWSAIINKLFKKPSQQAVSSEIELSGSNLGELEDDTNINTNQGENSDE